MIRAEKMCALAKEGQLAAIPPIASILGSGRVTIEGVRYRKIACSADGMCFYHAVANCLNHRARDEAWTAARIHEMVAQSHPDVAQTWADDSDVSTTARVLRLNIWVWEGANRMWIRFGEDSHLRIRLYNPKNIHYEALVAL
jgi:hypothetical protein